MNFAIKVLVNTTTGQPICYVLEIQSDKETRIWHPYSYMDARIFDKNGECTTDTFRLVEPTQEHHSYIVGINTALESFEKIAALLGMTLTQHNKKVFREKWHQISFREEHQKRVNVFLENFTSSAVDPLAEAEAFMKDFIREREKNIKEYR